MFRSVHPVPRVVIVGDRNSGKTTFLGLLYMAQVQSGSDLADDFRFHVTFESLDELSGAFQGLMSGAFPDSATKEGIRRVSFHLDFRKPKSGVLSRLRRERSDSDAAPSFQFTLLRNLDEFVSRLRTGSTIADGSLLDILASEVDLVVVDSTKLAASDEEPATAPLQTYDTTVVELLLAIRRSQIRSSRKLIHPIVVYTKFDSVPSEALKALDLDEAPPSVHDARGRAKYGNALLRRNLPKTLSIFESKESRGPNFAAPLYFFTWVRTERDGGKRSERVRLRRTGAVGWEPEYSRDEYIAFLESLWRIAGHSRA